MKIEILGTGCTKCVELEKNAKEAVAKSGKFAQVEKVSDIQQILNYGVMSTPAIVIDGEVKAVGRLLSVDEILSMIK